MDGFKADDARVIVIFGDIVRESIEFFESTVKHSLPNIHLFFHALGWERVSRVRARGVTVECGGVCGWEMTL